MSAPVPDFQFSVIMPTRNRLGSLRLALEALKAQSLPARTFEIVVADDGSSDGTAEYLAQAGARAPGSATDAGPPVRFARLDRPGGSGPGRARNAALALARGEWIAFTDDDCLVPRDWLERGAALLKSTGADALGGSVRNALPAALSEVYQDMAGFLCETRNREPGRAQFLTANNFFCRRAVLREAGAFDERFVTGAEERELVHRMLNAGRVVVYEPELCVEHRHRFTLGSYLAHLRRQGMGSRLLYRVAGREHGRPLRLPSAADALGLLVWVARRPGRGGPLVRTALAVAGQAAVAAGYVSALPAPAGARRKE